MRTRASAVRPENARVVLSSIGTILRIVRGSWSLDGKGKECKYQ